MTRAENLQNLLQFREIAQDGDTLLWEPVIGRRMLLGRQDMWGGGFIEFATPISGIFIHWAPTIEGQERSIRAYTTRKIQADDPATYLAGGFSPALGPEPDKDVKWTPGISFSPSVIAINVVGTFFNEDIVYG